MNSVDVLVWFTSEIKVKLLRKSLLIVFKRQILLVIAPLLYLHSKHKELQLRYFKVLI